MNEQKMDSERAAFEDWADSQWPGAKREQLKCDDYGEYLNSIYRDLWRGWQARASLPVGVPDGLLARIDSAIKAFTSGRASMHVPPEPDDVDMVLGECRALVNALIAAPAAPTVKAEQVPTVKLEWFQSRPGPDDSGDCIAPALPAAGSAGSAVEEVEVTGWVDPENIKRMKRRDLCGFMIEEKEDSRRSCALMTVAQHNRIVSALQKENEHLIYLLSCAKNYDLGPTLKGMVEDALTKHKDSNKL